MIINYFIICPGCAQNVRVRLGPSVSKGTNFYVPCPNCSLPIRGHFKGDVQDFVVDFRGAESGNKDESYMTITIDPNIPLNPSSETMRDPHSSPNITFGQITGRNFPGVLAAIQAVISAASVWPKLATLFEYYLEEQWDLYNRQGEQIFGNWTNPTSGLERDAVAYDAINSVLIPTIYGNQFPELAADFNNMHIENISIDSYRNFVRNEVNSGKLQKEMRRVFDELDSYMRNYESWLPGISYWGIDPRPNLDVSDLKLCRDEFPSQRDIFQQSFEVCCSSLKYVVAAINTSLRGSPTSFTDQIPPGVDNTSGNHPVNGFRKYGQLVNGHKLAYLFESSPWSTLAPEILDRSLRNAIGHASAKHDLRSGMVVSAGVSIPYYEFTAKVQRLIHILLVIMHVHRSMKVLAAEELGNNIPNSV